MNGVDQQSIHALWNNLVEPYEMFGIQPPIMLWYVAGALLLMFGLVAVCMIWQSMRFSRCLKHATKAILNIPTVGCPLDGLGIEQLERILSQNSVLSEQWEEFRETLIHEPQQNGNARIFNTVQSEEFFGENNTIERVVFARFYSALPGLLTGVGLLFTFVAILIALHGVTTADNKIRDGAIEHLIGGLSGKFVTSIVALSCSTVFILLERIFLGGLKQKHHKFILALNKRFARRSAELVLQEMHRNIAEQTLVFKRFDTDLSNSVKNSVVEGLGPLTERLASALDALSADRHESFADTIGPLIERFQESLMGSASTQFDSLAQTVRTTADTLNSLNENSSATNTRVAELIAQLDQYLGKQTQTSAEQLASLTTTMQDITVNLRDVVNRSSESLSSSVEGILNRLEQTATKQLDEVHAQNTRISDLCSSLTQQANEAASGSASTMLETLTTLMTRLDDSSKEQYRASQSQQEQLQIMFQMLSEKLKQALEDSSTSVKASVETVLDSSSAWAATTSERLAKALEEQGKAANLFNNANTTLERGISSLSSLVESFSIPIKDLSVTASSFREVSSSIKDAVARLNQGNDSLSGLMNRSEDARAGVQKLIADQTASSESFQRLMQQMDQSIGSLLKEIGVGVEDYKNKMKSSVEMVTSQLDNQLSSASSKLGRVVSGLVESLDTLQDLIPPPGSNEDKKRANS